MHKKSLKQLKEISLNERGFKLLSLSPKTQANILKEFSINEIIEMIEFLDPLKASKIIRKLSKIKRNRTLKKLGKNIQDKINLLLKFDPEKSGAILNFNYIEVGKESSVKEITKMISEYEKGTGKIPTVLVLENGYLVGEISMRNLMTFRKNCKAHKLISQIPHISCNESEEKVLSIFKKNAHGKVVVLNENSSILGIIHAEDVLHLFSKQASKSLHKFAGINKEEDICDNAITKVKYRYRWLVINLFTAFMAAAVVGLFESTISRLVILAAYLPIVAGMGGNAATQTLAITVRGMALDEVNKENIKDIVKQETIAGIMNGAITGAVAAVVAMFFGQTPLLGAVLFMAMTFNLFIAGFFGTLIPLFMKKIGKDPASSATIFITTATDVFGFLAFLGLATLIL